MDRDTRGSPASPGWKSKWFGLALWWSKKSRFGCRIPTVASSGSSPPASSRGSSVWSACPSCRSMCDRCGRRAAARSPRWCRTCTGLGDGGGHGDDDGGGSVMVRCPSPHPCPPTTLRTCLAFSPSDESDDEVAMCSRNGRTGIGWTAAAILRLNYNIALPVVVSPGCSLSASEVLHMIAGQAIGGGREVGQLTDDAISTTEMVKTTIITPKHCTAATRLQSQEHFDKIGCCWSE